MLDKKFFSCSLYVPANPLIHSCDRLEGGVIFVGTIRVSCMSFLLNIHLGPNNLNEIL